MDTLKAIQARRSIKKFDPDYVMSPQDVDQLLESVILSPTAFNIQNWRFVAISEQGVQQQFKEIGWNQAQFTDCSLLVVICGDRNAYNQEPERYWRNAPQPVREAMVPMIKGFYGANEPVRRDENLRSGGMAAQTLMVAAKAMGLDSCPMTGFDFGAAAKIINLPDEHDIVMAVTVGKALEEARERGGQLPLDEVVVRNNFPK
jgi:nitroreductase